MPNSIKYNTLTETEALNSGNFWIGVGDVDKGPTSTTGYWNGINPPSGGYTIYVHKASEGPSIQVASDDTELLRITNSIAGTSYTTINECFNYFAGQSDKMVVNREFESIITEGLTLNFDAGFIPSYPENGTTWYDLSGNSYNAVAGNFPQQATTNSTTTVLNFDGADDFILPDNINYGNSNRISEMSVFAWVSTTYNSGTPGVWNNNNWSILDFDRSEVFTFTLNGAGEVQMSGRDNTNNYFDIVGTQQCNDGNWHYVGWTYSSTSNDIIMYVDGAVDRTHSYGNLADLGTGGGQRWAVIGDGSERTSQSSTGRNNIYFDGYIGAIHFYDNKVLTLSEIQQNYNAQKSRFGL